MSEARKIATRRAVLRSGLNASLAVAAVAAAATTAGAQEAEKLAQSVVQYQATPKSDAPGNVCSKCVNFVAPNACKIVAGTIAPTGWCVAFAPKDS